MFELIIMIDNQDSFTYNLVDYLLTESDDEVLVVDSQTLDIANLVEKNPRAIVISPGPGKPSDYKQLHQVLDTFEGKVPILGVCLGFQLMVEYYGGKIIYNQKPVHGHTTRITTNQQGIFSGLPKQFNVMRYHSLCASQHDMPDVLSITAKNDEGIIMGIQHQTYPVFGVQYHPESILSEYGHEQIRLFLQQAGEKIVS